MATIPNLITDRTQADVTRAAQLITKWIAGVWTGSDDEYAEWCAGLKGAYNATDLNRVGTALNAIRDILNDDCGYAIDWEAKVDWGVNAIPSVEQLDAYLSYVECLQGILGATPNAPDSMSKLTIEAANSIEQILANCASAIHNLKAGTIYSGEIYAGEV